MLENISSEGVEALTVMRRGGGEADEQRLSQSCPVANAAAMSHLGSIEFDPQRGGVNDVIEQVYEIISVLLLDMRGIGSGNGEDDISYMACPQCNKKLDQEGKCANHGKAEDPKKIFLAHITLADPTGIFEGTAFDATLRALHELTGSSDETVLTADHLLRHLGGRPLVVRAYIKPNTYKEKEGTHQITLLAFKPMCKDSGLLGVFRAPSMRWPVATAIPPATPDDLKVNKSGQTMAHEVLCESFRLLVCVTSGTPTTNQVEGIEGMTCQHEARCVVTNAMVKLSKTGSHDALHNFYSLRQDDVASVICSTSHQNDSKSCVLDVAKLYLVKANELHDFTKGFKSELSAVKSYYTTKPESLQNVATPELKRKADDGLSSCSPRWQSPKRRLKVQNTKEAETSGYEIAESA